MKTDNYIGGRFFGKLIKVFYIYYYILKVEMTFWNATNFSCFDRCKNASLVKAVRLTYLVKVDHSFKTFCNEHSGWKILQSIIRKISFSPTVFL